jgi:transcription termination factor NusB
VRANRNAALQSVYRITQKQNEALGLLAELVNDYLSPEMTMEEIENAKKRLSSIRAQIAELTAEVAMLSKVVGPLEGYDS